MVIFIQSESLLYYYISAVNLLEQHFLITSYSWEAQLHMGVIAPSMNQACLHHIAVLEFIRKEGGIP